MIYFLDAGDTIKIGHSVDVRNRIAGLKSGSSKKLTLLGVMEGSVRQEKILHMAFAQHRVHGEWFKRCPQILGFIEENCTDLPPAEPASVHLPHIAEFFACSLHERPEAEVDLRDLTKAYADHCSAKTYKELRSSEFVRALAYFCNKVGVQVRTEGKEAFIVGMSLVP